MSRAVRAYLTSPARNLSADSIVRIGFHDGEVRHMPYLRRSLYFADLDAKIRARSGDRTLFPDSEAFDRRLERTAHADSTMPGAVSYV